MNSLSFLNIVVRHRSNPLNPKNWGLLLLILYSTAFSQTTVSYTTPGSYTWTVPSCVTSLTVQVWGGGGGGGGSIAIVRNTGDGEACSGAGGGGGGGYTSLTFAVIPGQVYNIVVGAGGSAGTAGAGTWSGGITTPPGAGGTGGLSSFVNYGINLQASGGVGGIGAGAYNNSNPPDVNVIGAGGAGGIGTGGSANFSGGAGAAGLIGWLSTDKSGGGGGAAGPGGNGGNAPLGSSYGIVDNNPGGIGNAPGGNGGASRMNNLPSNTTKNGGNGNVIGGGGGGGLNHKEDYGTMTGATGGSGARGEVRLIYTGVIPPLIAGTPQICSGSNVNLTASGSFVSYVWDTGSIGAALNVSPISTTTYTVTGTDGTGCTASQTYTVTVDPSPTALAGINVASICAGTPVNLSATSNPPLSSQLIADFESANPFTLINGSEYNKFYTGTAAKCNGSNGLYIGTASTNNNYVNATSSFFGWTQRPSVTFAYMDVPISNCLATLDFNWKCQGKATDNLSVWIIPTSVTPVAGTALVNGGSIIKIGGDYWNAGGSCNAVSGLNLLQGWVTMGQTIRLVFQWRNTGSGISANTAANSAAMVDDIVINQSDQILFNWTSSATGFTSTQQNPTDTPSTSTTYSVSATSCNNSCSTVATVDVVVDPCPLPIELIAFEGICDGDLRSFTWSTASELNNQYFTIEHSTNGQEFTPVQYIMGAGNSSVLKSYRSEFVDTNGFVYYRLKQTDFDGHTEASDVIVVDCNQDLESFSIYPNPAQNLLVLSYDAKTKENYVISIYDMLGRKVATQAVTFDGPGRQMLNIDHLAAGSFIIELWSVESEKSMGMLQFIKH